MFTVDAVNGFCLSGWGEWWSSVRGLSIKGTVVQSHLLLKFRQFHSPHICLCLSEETLNASGSFYLVSMPGEVKDPTQGVNV